MYIKKIMGKLSIRNMYYVYFYKYCASKKFGLKILQNVFEQFRNAITRLLSEFYNIEV